MMTATNPNTTAMKGIRRGTGNGDSVRCFRDDHDPWREILRAREAAHAKHGPHSIEALPADDPRWLPVLVEEVGEVARALTYDNHSRARLRTELVDVLAVASAWLAASDRGAEQTPQAAVTRGGRA